MHTLRISHPAFQGAHATETIDFYTRVLGMELVLRQPNLDYEPEEHLFFHVGNDNATRSNTIGGFGHYEDEMVKVNGQWFFTKRTIFNEGSARWQYKGDRNPAW